MATQKPRTNITLFNAEKAKLEHLSKVWGISQSRVVGRLLREYELKEDAVKPDSVFHAFIDHEEDIFVAHCIEYGVTSQGETEEEALFMLTEAVSLYLEEMHGESFVNLFCQIIDTNSETASLFRGKNGECLRDAIANVQRANKVNPV